MMKKIWEVLNSKIVIALAIIIAYGGVTYFEAQNAKKVRESYSTRVASKNSELTDMEKSALELKSLITISEPIKLSDSSKDKYAFTVTNDSDRYIKNIRLNCEFYKEGKLIDHKTESLYNSGIIEPGEKYTASVERYLGRSSKQPAPVASDKVKITLTTFEAKTFTKKEAE